MEPKHLSDIDRRLIALLQADARETTTALAKKLGIARTTVHERINRLERIGVVAGYSVVLSRDPFEDYAQAVVMLSIAQRQQRSVVNKLRNYIEIKVCLSMSGEFDLFLMVEAPRLEDLDELLDEIAEIPGIEKSRSSIMLSRKFDRRFTEIAARMNLAGSKQDG